MWNPLDKLTGMGKTPDLHKKEKEYAKTMSTLATDELGRYRSGKGSAPQQKDIAAVQAKAEEGAQAYAKEAGGDNQEEVKRHLAVSRTHMKLNTQLLENAQHENTWKKGMQSLGLSMEASAKIVAEFQQEQAETKQAFMGLMSTIGVVGMSAFGGAGGMAAMMGAKVLTGGMEESQGGAVDNSDLA